MIKNIFKYLKYIPPHILYFIKVYLLGILIFFIFRLILFYTEINQINVINNPIPLVLKAFYMGWRFDTVISCYIIFLPFLIFSILSFLGLYSKIILNVTKYIIISLFSLAFFICAVDIPFFNYYFSRLNVIIFSWTKNASFGFKMVIQEKTYLVYFFIFIVLNIIYIAIFRLIKIEPFKKGNGISNRIFHLFLSIIVLGVIFIGIRGRIEKKSPIRVGTAYFSNYSFINQLGLNPVFTLVQSFIESKNEVNNQIKLIDDREAIKLVNSYLKINNSEIPFVRDIKPNCTQIKPNIVLILMESMSAKKMKRYGNDLNITPFLDSISQLGYNFEQCYSAGIHTFNGIYSTLFSYPSILKKHTMNLTEIPQYTGFANTLSDLGYNTIYFTTHDEQFDNVSGFLHANGFKKIISQKDYPSKAILSTLGVPDHYMFEFSLPELNNLAKENKPFFSVFLTSSDHGPYIVPDDIPFKPKNKDIKNAIVEYADWSLKHFMVLCSNEKWFSNTIFIFTADHGSIFDNSIYDIPLSYNHIPFIIYSPEIIKSPKSIDTPCGQIDIFPTLMGILGIKYINNTAGVDVFNEPRPFMYFCADDKIGCIDNQYFYLYRVVNNTESLYKWKDNDTKDYINELKAKSDSMKKYSFSMLQASQWMINNKKTGKILK